MRRAGIGPGEVEHVMMDRDIALPEGKRRGTTGGVVTMCMGDDMGGAGLFEIV